MFKMRLLLMVVTVNPILACTPVFSASFYTELNENYALFARTKAAVGKSYASFPAVAALFFALMKLISLLA